MSLWVGLAIIVGAEALLGVDVVHRHGATVPQTRPENLVEPTTWLGHAGRYVAVNMTPLCWLGYLLILDGTLTWLDRSGRRRKASASGPATVRQSANLSASAKTVGYALSSIRARPNRFVIAWLSSIPVWAVFDTLNFYFFDAWRYHGLPGSFSSRVVGYFIAFAAISPGMFLAGQLAQGLGLRRVMVRGKPGANRLAWAAVIGPPLVIVALTLTLLVNRPGEMGWALSVIGSALLLLGPAAIALAAGRSQTACSLGVGVGFTLWAVVIRDPIACMTLWVGLIYLLDPWVRKWSVDAYRAPSLIADWQAGRWGRTLSLMAGGTVCGLLWEFWNYWAIAKWTYHLPFLGPTAQWSYFEMPVLGFLGFLPFACECWVMFNLIVAAFDRAGLRVVEPLADDDGLL